MIRRPLAAAAAAYGAGIALQHLADGTAAAAAVTGSVFLLLCLFFYFIFNWNKIEQKYINRRIKNKSEGQEEARPVDEDLQNRRGAPDGRCAEEADPRSADAASWRQDVRRTYSALTRCAAIAVVFASLGAAAGYITENRISQFNDMFGETVTISGRIRSVEIKADDRCALVLEARTVGGSSGTAAAAAGGAGAAEEPAVRQIRNEKVLVTVDNIDGRRAAALTGYTVSVTGEIEKPSGASNPGAFDYSLYLLSRDIRATMYTESGDMRVSQTSPRGAARLLNIIMIFKYDYEQRIISQLDDRSAQMLLGILFGDDSFMEEDLKLSFQQNGLAHLLAASGLHVGFVYGLLHILMGRPVTVRGNMPLMTGLIVYAALAGFSPSVVRAVFMIIVHIVGNLTYRRYDFLTCISFCALALLIYQPMNLFASGFQLSFLAVFTLSVVLKRAESLLSGIYKVMGDKKAAVLGPAISSAAGTAALQLGMMPLTVRNFHYMSIAGFFLNGPAIALAGLIVPLGIILIPLAYLGGPLFVFAGSMEEMLVRLLIWMSDLFAGTVLSFRYTASPPTAAFVFYYIMLFFICSETGQACVKSMKYYGKMTVAAPLIAAAVAAAGCGFAADADYLLSDLIFVDVGQGDCAHLKGDGGTDIIFDSGGSEKKDVGIDTLAPYFLGNGVGDIDMAVISHLHTDHYGGLLTLKDAVKIKRLALPAVYEPRAAEIEKETGVPQENMMFLKAGDTVSAGGGITLHVLAPAAASYDEYVKLLEGEEDENMLSLIIKAEYKGRTMLFTGDIDEEYERELVKLYGTGVQSDILKAAHHGSKYSTCAEFLEYVDPGVCVIQVGRNLYGHPTPEALQRIDDAGCLMFRNDTDGAVMFSLGDNMRIRTMKQRG